MFSHLSCSMVWSWVQSINVWTNSSKNSIYQNVVWQNRIEYRKRYHFLLLECYTRQNRLVVSKRGITSCRLKEVCVWKSDEFLTISGGWMMIGSARVTSWLRNQLFPICLQSTLNPIDGFRTTKSLQRMLKYK